MEGTRVIVLGFNITALSKWEKFYPLSIKENNIYRPSIK